MGSLNFFTDPSELAPKPRRGRGKLRGSQLAVDLMGCSACGLFARCHSPKMEPYGRGLKSIMVVGESPGEEEDSQGIPFVGKTGIYVSKLLRGMGINLDDDCIRQLNLITDASGIDHGHAVLNIKQLAAQTTDHWYMLACVYVKWKPCQPRAD